MANTVSPTPTRTSSSNALGAMSPLRGNRLLHLTLWEWVSFLQAVRISVIAVVTLVLVFWDRRTGK
jgi:hypothetical protein